MLLFPMDITIPEPIERCLYHLVASIERLPQPVGCSIHVSSFADSPLIAKVGFMIPQGNLVVVALI